MEEEKKEKVAAENQSPEKSETDELKTRVAELIYSSRGWITLLGVVFIISGVFTCLSIVGIIVGWLPIWIGVILTQAATEAGNYADTLDSKYLVNFMEKLKKYFTLQGIAIIVAIVFYIGVIIFYVMVIGLAGFAGIMSAAQQ